MKSLEEQLRFELAANNNGLKSLDEQAKQVNERIDSLVIQQELDKEQLATNISYINTAVGFNAGLSTSSISNPIKYTNVVANKGNRYSPSTGKFTADRSGLYYFEQYWLMYPDKDQWLYMRKNGDIVCQSLGNSANDGDADYNSPSCSVVLELQSGDEVYVTSSHGKNVYTSSSTRFTGFLIKAYV